MINVAFDTIFYKCTFLFIPLVATPTQQFSETRSDLLILDMLHSFLLEGMVKVVFKMQIFHLNTNEQRKNTLNLF